MIVSFQNSEQKVAKFVNFKIPGNSRREFTNSREFLREFLGWRIHGGIPGGPARDKGLGLNFFN